MTTPRPALGDFEEFYRSSYRKLLAYAMYVGASLDEAEEAVGATMAEVFARWQKIENPVAYARRATVSNFVKERTRPRRLVRHLMNYGQVADSYDDPGLSIWEDSQWVKQLLASLPQAQRDVMAGIVDDFRPAEIALLLGKSPDAVRQSLRLARQRLRLALEEQAGQHGRSHSSPREDR